MKSIMVMIIETKIKEFLEHKEWKYSEDLDLFLERIKEHDTGDKEE